MRQAIIWTDDGWLADAYVARPRRVKNPGIYGQY